jgi:hypothetical protein
VTGAENHGQRLGDFYSYYIEEERREGSPHNLTNATPLSHGRRCHCHGIVNLWFYCSRLLAQCMRSPVPGRWSEASSTQAVPGTRRWIYQR